MSTSGWIICAGGSLVLAIMLWPADGTRWSLRPGRVGAGGLASRPSFPLQPRPEAP